MLLSDLLSRLGIQSDLTAVGPDDVATMVARAEEAKAQAQGVTVYVGAAKSVLTSAVKVAKAKADLYGAAHEKLKEVDGYIFEGEKANLAHQVHAVRMDAKLKSEQAVTQAKLGNVQELASQQLQKRLLLIGQKHRKAIRQAKPVGLLGGLFR